MKEKSRIFIEITCEDWLNFFMFFAVLFAVQISVFCSQISFSRTQFSRCILSLLEDSKSVCTFKSSRSFDDPEYSS